MSARWWIDTPPRLSRRSLPFPFSVYRNCCVPLTVLVDFREVSCNIFGVWVFYLLLPGYFVGLTVEEYAIVDIAECLTFEVLSLFST